MGNEGWRCPGCGKFWAPFVEECKRCAAGESSSAASAGVPTFADLWDKHYAPWAERHQSSWKSVRRGHREHLFEHFGALPWTACTHSEADRYVDKRKKAVTKHGKRPVKPATINNELASAKACINFCLTGAPEGQRPIRGHNPLDKYPELPVVSERRFHIGEDDFVQLLEHARPLLRLMLVFSFETGMRRDEFRCLEWAEVDVEHAVVRLPPGPRTKNRKGRDVPLSDVALAVLKAVPRFARSIYVFENPKGNNKPVPETTLDTWFRKARESAGVKGPKGQEVWIHTLRKSFGTIQAMAGMPIYQLMDVMGHSSADVHFEYTRMSPEYHGSVRARLNRRIGPQSAPATKPEPEEEAPRPSPLLAFVRPE